MEINHEVLISAILAEPCIWMSRHRHHHDRRMIKRAWEHIKELDPHHSVDDLKKKWKNLKDTYRREMKRNPVGRSGDSGNNNISQWKYFEMMSFLRDEIIPCKADTNFTRDSQTINSQVLFDSENEDNENVNNSQLNTASPASGSSIIMIPPKRKNTNDIRAEFLEIEKKRLELLQNEIQCSTTDDGHTKSEDYHFLMSLLPQMQMFTPAQKFRVRTRMNMMMMEEINQTSTSQPLPQYDYNSTQMVQQPAGYPTQDQQNAQGIQLPHLTDNINLALGAQRHMVHPSNNNDTLDLEQSTERSTTQNTNSAWCLQQL